MIAVAMVGGLLALPNGCGVIVLVGCLPCLAVIALSGLYSGVIGVSLPSDSGPLRA